MATTNPLNSPNSRTRLLEALKTEAPKDRVCAELLAKYSASYLKPQDGTIKTIKQANAVGEVSLFDPTDEKRTGIYTLSKGLLETDQAFFVTHISLRAYAVVSGGNPAVLTPRSQDEYDAMQASDSFGPIQNIAAIANGECELRINRKPMFNKLSNQVFNNASEGGYSSLYDGQMGVYQLTNAFLIKPQTPIELILRFPVATPPSTLIEAMFIGAQTIAA